MYSQFALPRLARPAALILALATLFGAAPAAAQHHAHPPENSAGVRAGGLTLTGTWARATPPAARTGAVYLAIANEGTEPDRLVSAATPAAAAVELHANVMEGGIARMSRVDAIDVRPGEPAVFQPAGLHIMLVDLRAPLRDGERFPLTLTFARAGAVTIDVPVRRTAPSGSAPPQPHEH